MRGISIRSCYFIAMGLSSMKMVAVSHRHNDREVTGLTPSRFTVISNIFGQVFPTPQPACAV